MMVIPKDKLSGLFEHDDFLILTHKRPDGDTLGSAEALCTALRYMGKSAYVKENIGITKKYADLCNDMFSLDTFRPGYVISVDIADEALLPKNALEYSGRIDLAIDHHMSHTGYAKETILDDRAAATGEIIYEIIKMLKVPFDMACAKAIYTAISTDTGCFRYANTTARTFHVAAACFEAGVDGARLNRTLFESKSFEKYNIERYVMSNTEFYDHYTIAVVAVESRVIEEIGAVEDDLENISAILRQPEGVLAGIFIRGMESGECKVSVRTNEEISAADICKKLGGGGHARAAGCTIQSSIDTAKKQILSCAREVIALSGN